MAAANLANIQVGGDRVSEQSANLRNGLTSQDEAAELLQVSRRSVQTAAKVKRTAPAEVVEAVKLSLVVHPAERRHHLGAQQLAHRSDGKQVLAAVGDLVSVVEGEASTGDNRVQVRMMTQFACPGVEHQGHPQLGAESLSAEL